MTSASSRFAPGMVHAFFDPEVTSENGEVKVLEASSIVLRTLPSLPAVEVPEERGESPFVFEGVPSVRASCWWVDAPFAWSTANTANEAMTIRQITNEANRSNPAIEDMTPLH